MYAIIAHGGAGKHPEKEKAKKGMKKAIKRGEKYLKNKKNILKSVEETVKVLEDLPTFNSGKGSVLTRDGEIKMDACIADSKPKIGAVANIEDIRHPISLAHDVLEKTNHVFIGGKEATNWARKLGYQEFNPFTKRRIKERKKKLEKNKLNKNKSSELKDTVGAVAINKEGKLAAATSTGGKSLKKNGRIGDSPLFGAGTYVDKNVASSATGDGESIIKTLLTKKIAYLRKNNYLKESLKQALEEFKNEAPKNASCGIISVDKDYNISYTKNTRDMPVAYTKKNSKIKVSI